MKILLPFLFAMTVSPEQVRFEMELDFSIRQVFLESIVKTFTGVSRPDVCAKHCVGHQNCSAFGFNTKSNACQLVGDMLFKESAVLAPLIEGQRYYFIKKAWCPLGQGFLLFRRTGLCLRWVDSLKDWDEAAANCDSFGGRLAVLNSEKKLNDVFSAVRNIGYENFVYHVGASDAAKEGTWVWSDGTPVTMTWKNNEPSGNNGENCLMVLQGKGLDVPCNYYKVRSLCEITVE